MNKRLKSINRILAALLAFALFPSWSGAITSARTVDQITNDINSTSQQKAGLEKQQLTITEQLAAGEQKIKDISADILVLQDQLATIEPMRVTTEQDLARVQAELAVSEDRLTAQNDLIDNRLSGIYKQGDTGYIEVILGATSFDDFVSRMTYLGLIIKSDTRVMLEYKSARDKVEKDRDLVDTKKQDILSRERAIQAIKAPLDIKQKELSSQQAYMNGLLALVATDKQAATDMLNALQAEYNRAQDIARGGGTGGEAPSGFLWPVPQWTGKINSYYGYRDDPFGAGSAFHHGIDIDAWEGTPIIAPAAGTVSDVSWSDAVGNTFMINHGGGVSTFYCHCNTIYVSPGQHVTAGEVVAAVGWTGYRVSPRSPDGAHLHFGVIDLNDPNRDSNDFVNPIPKWVNP